MHMASGVVVRACSPNSLRGWGRSIALVQEFKTSLGNIVKVHLQRKEMGAGE